MESFRLVEFLTELESLIAPMGHDYSKEAIHWKQNSAKIISQTKQVIEAMAKQIAEQDKIIENKSEHIERFLRSNLESMAKDEAEAALLALARYVVSRS